MTFDFKIEQRRAVVGAVELVGHGLVDRHRDRLGRRIAIVAALNGQCLVFHACRRDRKTRHPTADLKPNWVSYRCQRRRTTVRPRNRGKFEGITLIVCHESRRLRRLVRLILQILCIVEAKDSLCCGHADAWLSSRSTGKRASVAARTPRCATGCARSRPRRRSPAKPHRILLDAIEDVAAGHADAEALISEHATLTYRALIERSRRYARWALDQKLAKGETVCLMMPNRPDYLAIWLGITSVGGVVSLLNTQLRGPALAHCIDIVAAKHVIVAGDLVAQFNSAAPGCRPKLWSHGRVESGDFVRIDREVERFSAAPLTSGERRGVTIADRALTIYTSGTTGLPKAANVSHRRLMQWSLWFGALMNATPDDRMYDCLPLYHSVGGVVAVGALLTRGGSVVIREKFSAREFWDDVDAMELHAVSIYRRTVPLSCQCAAASARARASPAARLRQRVARGRLAKIPIPLRRSENSGILCRDRRQRVALQCRGQSRRGRPRAAVSDAPLSAGAGQVRCRRRGSRARRRRTRAYAAPLMRSARRSAECRRRARRSRGRAFEGYTSAAETERKILRDVFEPGDAWFRTGDLMRMDASGLLSISSTGSATPSAGKARTCRPPKSPPLLTEFPGISEATVYGVAVPGTEGKAGMARRRRRRCARLVGAATPISRAGCRTMRDRCSCGS